MHNTNKHTLVFEVSQACQGGSCGESCECSLWDGREFKPGDLMPDILHEGCMCIYRPKTLRGTRLTRSRPLQKQIEDMKTELTKTEMTNQKRRHLEMILSNLVRRRCGRSEW